MTAEFRAAIAAQHALADTSSNEIATIDAGDEPMSLDEIIDQASAVSKAWVIEIPGLGAVCKRFTDLGNVTVFHTDRVPDSIFATTEPLAPGNSTVLISKGAIGAAVDEPDAEIIEKRVTKVLKTDEERFVLGVVLEPETPDSQGDIYSASEVRKAAHGFMERTGALGKQHSEIVTGKLKVLESYIVPADFEQDSQKVTKGTWLLAVRVVDDDLWGGIKKGEFTGFSIGGFAFRKPEES